MKNHHPLTKLAACFMIAFLVVLPRPLSAADMTGGYVFTPTDRVTSTKLNALVGSGSISTTFFTDKSTAQAVAGDTFLFYSAASAIYKKASLNILMLQNTNLIVGQSEDVTPATNDFLLTLDVSANTLKKSQLNSAFFTNDALINARTNWTTPSPSTTFVLAYDQGSYSKLSISNLFFQWWSMIPFSTNSPTNFLLSVHSAPTNTDGLLIWDSVGKTNKATTLLGLVTNRPTATVVTNTDWLEMVSTATNANNPFGTNPTISKLVVTNLVRTFASSQLPVPNATAVTTNAHGLPGKPQMLRLVMVCTNAELGFLVGDEMDVSYGVRIGASNQDPLTLAADSTNVYINYGGSSSAWTLAGRKSDGIAGSSITKGNWNLKFYAVYFPF